EAAEDLIPDTAYNAWRITSLSTLPGWLLALAMIALAGGVWLSFRGFRSEPAGYRRVALLSFRLTAALLVLILLLEPGIELRAESRVRARVALLFDTSRSMKFPASPAGPTRAEELRRWAAQPGEDLAVERIAVDDFAFVRNQVTVDVVVTARGFGSTDVPIVLRREGQVVAQKTVHVDGSRTRYEVKLAFVPDRTGKFAFTVSAPVYEGEAIAQNNSRSFVLKVIRDRVRVLLVVGRPSWDVRFLRQLLKKNPNVDLISFFILRT